MAASSIMACLFPSGIWPAPFLRSRSPFCELAAESLQLGDLPFEGFGL
jgi:hypothetical protein